MKILFFLDRLRRGGIQTLLYNLTVQLTKKNDVHIDYLLFEDTMAPDLELEMIEMGCNVYKVFKPNSVKSFFYCCHGLNVFFRRHHDYDIVHTHTSTKAVLPLYYARKYRIRHRIQHSHSTGFQTSNCFWIFVGNILKAPVCRLANDYFACSDIAGRWMFDNIFANKKIEVKIINNAIEPSKFAYNLEMRKEVKKELGIPDNVAVIGNVASLKWVKNHKFLVEVFAEYNKHYQNAFLILVGIGELKKDIELQVKQYGLENNVLFLGQRIDVNRIYQAFDVFCMPSFYEGLPFAGIEAQMAGLPCLFSDTISSDVKVLDSTSFLNLKAPIKDWVEELHLKIVNIPRKDTTRELTKAGYNIVSEADKLYNYYNQIIENPSA